MCCVTPQKPFSGRLWLVELQSLTELESSLFDCVIP